ncbi:MAG: hypothetical protein DHS20C15_32100 [Planctomycetota bacterium]|nr:MAG: hypothetical protein DHS20C15_32100 [Planctomycetota bacterium]
MKLLGLVFCAFALGAPLAAAQSVLPDNTAVVVTTDGVWVPDTQSNQPLVHIAPTQFPGAPSAFVRPAIEWHRSSDSLLVTTGAQLFQVTLTSLAPPTYTVVEITPASSAPLDLWDIDVHPGSGEIFLLDQTFNEVSRYAPPFALGMQPDLVLPVPGTSRAMAIDSRSIPPSVVVTETSSLTRVDFAGQLSQVTEVNGTRGVDADPQVLGDGAVFMVAPSANQVSRAASSPNLVVSMNLSGFCTPLAIKPEDVEWNPLKNRAYVIASDGINPAPSCQSQVPAVGPNHVISFPIAQAPPVVVPKLITHGSGSGITGTQADLTLVLGDFAFVSPYGEACVAGSPSALRLQAPFAPDLGFPTHAIELSNASPNALVFALAGFSPAQLPFGFGCSLFVQPDFIKWIGTTDAQGEFSIDVPLPPGVIAGYEAFLQMAVPSGGAVALSGGLQVHYGE